MSRWLRRALALGGAVCGLAGAAPAQAQVLDPITPTPGQDPPSETEPPGGFTRSSREVIALASRTRQVRRELQRHDRLTGDTFVLPSPPRWIVNFAPPGAPSPVLELTIDDRTGRVVKTWDGYQAGWPMARGREGYFGGRIHALYVWLPLAMLFFFAFFDPRRPFRLLHADLVALLAFGASHAFFSRGEVGLSVPLAYPVLAYLLIRMAVAGLRPRRRGSPLVPLLSPRALAMLLGALVVGRIAFNLLDSSVIDVGYASVIGADRIAHGEELYVDNATHGDTYGPLNYLAYVPFELVFPYVGRIDDLWAAHAAAITFDAATLAGLFLLGTQLRAGADGRLLGLVLAFGWAAYPYTSLALMSNTNDVLVAALVVFSLVLIRSPVARGLVLGAAVGAKFSPGVLVPLLAAGRRFALSAAARSAAVVAVICATLLLVWLPDGGLQEFWDTTIGFQFSRESPFSVWGQEPGLEWLRTALVVGIALFACTVAFRPRARTVPQLAGLAACLLIALQLIVDHWFYLYIVWFAPALLVALFSEHASAFAKSRTGLAQAR